MDTFEALGIPQSLCDQARASGWNGPTPVQKEAVPAGLSGRNVIVRAQTGTGKTAAYAFVVLSLVRKGGVSPAALVIAPTRELAMQIDTEMRRLSKGTGHICVPVYGGADITRQIRDLRRGADVVIGTPGRIKDLMTRGDLVLSDVSAVVIDEADRMLDMGFEEDLNAILDGIPAERQTLMLSATMDERVTELAEQRLPDPVFVDISGDDAVTGLTKQYIVKCMRQEKKDLLTVLLNKGTPKTIVFFATKSFVDEVFREMRDLGMPVGTLHGDMPQDLREKVIGNFRDNRILTLLATDVAARGLDISDVDMVVNFDLPRDPETYVHRIGRTGRAGKAGISVSLATSRDMQYIPLYEQATGSPMEILEPTEMDPILAEHRKVVRKKPSKTPSARPKGPKAKRDRNAVLEGTVTLELSVGKADGYKRVEIAGFVRNRGRLGDSDVGKVGL